MTATEHLRSDHEEITLALSILERLAERLGAGQQVEAGHFEQLLAVAAELAESARA